MFCKACGADVDNTLKKHFTEEVEKSAPDEREDLCPRCLAVSEECFLEMIGESVLDVQDLTYTEGSDIISVQEEEL